MFLSSKLLMRKTFWPRTESRIWRLISPSLNLVLLSLPRPISRWLAISRASFSASREKSFRDSNSDWREVRKILLMVVSISVGVSDSSSCWLRGLQQTREGAIIPPTIFRNSCLISLSINKPKHILIGNPKISFIVPIKYIPSIPNHQILSYPFINTNINHLNSTLFKRLPISSLIFIWYFVISLFYRVRYNERKQIRYALAVRLVLGST